MNTELDYLEDRVDASSYNLARLVRELPGETAECRKRREALERDCARLRAEIPDLRRDAEEAAARCRGQLDMAACSGTTYRMLQGWLRSADRQALAMRGEARLGVLAIQMLLVIDWAMRRGVTPDSLRRSPFLRLMLEFSPAAFDAVRRGVAGSTIGRYLDECWNGTASPTIRVLDADCGPPVTSAEMGYQEGELRDRHIDTAIRATGPLIGV